MAKSTSVSPRDLCLRLMRADTQVDVIDALTQAGYWGNAAAWRLFDDSENNYSTIGNQQSRAEAALVEKIVNSIERYARELWIGSRRELRKAAYPSA